MKFEKPTRKRDPVLLREIREKRCLVCGRTPCDPHHVKTVKTGGDDSETNCMPLCRTHHTMIHKIGPFKMADTSPAVMHWLHKHGWYFDSHGKLRRES